MKKISYLAAIALITLASACGNNATDSATAPAAPSTETPTADAPAVTEYPEGLALINGSDCTACHNAQQKVVGPAFKDIAAKYPNTPENVAHLVDQVIKGSTGVWGQVPMVPHANLPKDKVEQMVQYILSVR